jgi:hypothetical protein
MKNFLLVFLFLSYSIVGYTEDNQSLQEIENIITDNETEESEIDLRAIDKFKYYDRFTFPVKKVPIKKIVPPIEGNIFYAVLKKDAIIYNLKTNKGKIIWRKIYAKVKEKQAGGRRIFILDKHNKIEFYTDASNIIPLEKELILSPNPTQYFTYKPYTRKVTNDDSIILESYLSLPLEISSNGKMADIFNSTNQTTNVDPVYVEGLGIGLEYKLFHKWKYPFNFGITTKFQYGHLVQYEVENNNYKATAQLEWDSLSFGPIIQYWAKRGSFYEINFHLSFQQSFFHYVFNKENRNLFSMFNSRDDNILELSTQNIELAFNNLFTTRYGKFFCGVMANRSFTSVKRTILKKFQTSVFDNSIFGFGIMFGYNFETIL